MAGAWGAAGGVAAGEVCAPLLLLCWLCCWPGDDSSDSSSGKHPQKPVVAQEGSSHRRPADFFSRRFGSSAVSLHLPSTSGTKQPLSSHRSHEEIRSRRKSQHEATEDGRYHSAPSVIDEVLHRRDWERSTRDLFIPLRADNTSIATDSLDDSIGNSNEQVENTCKKHHTNIKSSKKKKLNKELLNEDVKDNDATENSPNVLNLPSLPSFYIGEAISNEVDDNTKDMYKAKEAKQSLNESIRCKDQHTRRAVNSGAAADRSGAEHHSMESRSSLYHVHHTPVPPPSVEAVGYDSDASYLAEDDVIGPWREESQARPVGRDRPAGQASPLWTRGRHASAGDVLAPPLRPCSAALSESELDLELSGCDEPPPAYHLLHLLPHSDRKETAI